MRKTVSEKIAERYAEFERHLFEKFEREHLPKLTIAQRLEGCPRFPDGAVPGPDATPSLSGWRCTRP